MTDTIIAVMPLIGSALGVIISTLIANRINAYRLDKLEEKVDKHNGMIERMYIAEGKIVELQHEVKDLKEERRTA